MVGEKEWCQELFFGHILFILLIHVLQRRA
jgi:hypothetical protein